MSEDIKSAVLNGIVGALVVVGFAIIVLTLFGKVHVGSNYRDEYTAPKLESLESRIAMKACRDAGGEFFRISSGGPHCLIYNGLLLKSVYTWNSETLDFEPKLPKLIPPVDCRINKCCGYICQ